MTTALKTLAYGIALATAAVPAFSANGTEPRPGSAAPFHVTDMTLADESFFIDTTITYLPGGYLKNHTALAYGDSIYLLVWADLRNGTDYNIYCSRVGRDGMLIDPVGLPVCSAPGKQDCPSVAYDGEHFVITWQDYRSGTNWDVYVARVTPEMQFLEPDGLPVSVGIGDQTRPYLASGDSCILVVWADTRNDTLADIYGARFSKILQLLDPQGIPITSASRVQCNPRTAFHRGRFFTVWQDKRNVIDYDIYGARLTQTGNVLDTAGIVISDAADNQDFPDIAAGDSVLLAVWQDTRTGTQYDVYSTRLDENGTVFDSAGFLIASGIQGGYEISPPGIVYGPGEFCAHWHKDQNIYVTRVSQSGAVLDSSKQISMHGFPFGDEYFSCVAFDGINYLAAWQKWESGKKNGDTGQPKWATDECSIVGMLFDASGNRLFSDELVFDLNANEQYNLKGAGNGSDYFVAWFDRIIYVPLMGNPRYQDKMYGKRLSPAGQGLDTSNIVFQYPDMVILTVSAGSSTYLVGHVNANINAKMAQRVAFDGTLTDSTGYAIITDGTMRNLTMAFDSTNFVAVFDTGVRSFGVRISQDGVTLDDPPKYINAGNHPGVAYGGGKYLALTCSVSTINNIVGKLISPSLTWLTGSFTVSSAADTQKYPQCAYAGSNFFGVWQDRRSGASWDIYGSRISPAGVVLDPQGIAICTAPGEQILPAVAFDGRNIIVVWQDKRNGTDDDLFGAVVDTGGAVIDTFVAASGPGDQQMPSLVTGTSGTTLLLYTGYVDSVNNHWVAQLRAMGKMLNLTGVAGRPISANNDGFMLQPNHPNPFASKTILQYQLPADGKVLLEIYNIAGQLIRTLTHGEQKAGQHSISWNGRDEHNRGVASGVYLYRLDAMGQTRLGKMTLLR